VLGKNKVSKTLTPWSRVLEKLIVTQPVKKSPWNPKVQYHIHKSPPYFPNVHSNIIFPSTPRSSERTLPFRISTQNFVCISYFHKCYMPHPSHPWLDHPGKTWWSIQIMKIIMQSSLQPHATSSLLGSNILLSTLFPNTFNVCSSLSVRDEVSRPYKTTGKIIVL
jgi:hypothetical protein